MNKGRFVTAVTLSLAIATALAPSADAFGGRGGRGGGGGAFRGRPSGVQQPVFNPGFMAGFNGFNPGGYNRSFPGFDTPSPNFLGFPGFRGSNRGVRGQGGFGTFAPWGTTTVWGDPVDYGYGYASPAPASYPAITYAPQFYAPAYPPPYVPQMGGSISVAPAPPTSVVSFPGGRYELRGDGIAAPFQWVWVPNSQPVPPAPPTAPPGPPERAPSEQSPPADDSPARRSQLYRWTDDQGVVHWTNRAESVPAKHRAQAKYEPS